MAVHVALQHIAPAESPSTYLARKGLNFLMSLKMMVKRAFVRETFPTFFTRKWPLATVNSEMHSQCSLLSKSFPTLATDKLLHAIMNRLHVADKVTAPSECNPALIAPVVPLIRVDLLVGPQVPRVTESPTTDITLEDSLPSVGPHVSLHGRYQIEGFTAYLVNRRSSQHIHKNNIYNFK